MRRSHALLVLLVLLAAVTLVVGPSTGAPPPERLCGICGQPSVDVPGSDDADIFAEKGTLTIEVFENGSSRWTERAKLAGEGNDIAQMLAANQTLRHAVVYDARQYRRSAMSSHEFTARVEGDVLVVTYNVEDVARRGYGDVLLFDFFHDPRGENYYRAAEELVVRGPSNTVVTNEPPEAIIRDGAAVWRDTTGYTSHPEPTTQTYVAFGPGTALQYQVATALTIASDVGPEMVIHTLTAGLLVALLWAISSFGMVALDRRLGGRWTGSNVRKLLAGLGVAYGALGIILSLSMGSGTFGLLLVAVSIAVGGALFYALSIAVDASRRDQRVAVTRPALLSGWALLLVPILLPVLGPVVVGAPILFWIGLGGARPGRERVFAVLSVAIVSFGMLLPVTPIGGYGPAFVAIVFGVLALLTIPLAIMLFFVGRLLATRDIAGGSLSRLATLSKDDS